MPVVALRYRGFGASWCSDITLDPLDLDENPVTPTDITVQAVETLPERGPGTAIGNGLLYRDGFRLRWGDEVTFDVFEGTRIAYLPGAEWRGALPASFYGTVVALASALRGLVPFHASAVEVDGRAVLIAGPSGAGKSTLVAQMLGLGARLLADDLSVVEPSPDGLMVCRGRSTIRLHRETAERIPGTMRGAVPEDIRDKWVVRPLAQSRIERAPLAGVILLREPDRATSAEMSAQLSSHLFRPRWMKALPGQRTRLTAVLQIATQLPVRGATPLPDFHRDDVSARHVLALIGDMIDPSTRR